MITYEWEEAPYNSLTGQTTVRVVRIVNGRRDAVTFGSLSAEEADQWNDPMTYFLEIAALSFGIRLLEPREPLL